MKQLKITKRLLATIDDEDFSEAMKYKWHAVKGKHTFYASTWIGNWKNRQPLRLHWLIMGKPKEGNVIDHIDGNGLNNQRINLRVCTNQQNSCNRISYGSSKYLGVSIVANRKIPHWRSFLAGRYLGIFKSEEAAAKAYNEAAINQHGEYANLNIIANNSIKEILK